MWGGEGGEGDFFFTGGEDSSLRAWAGWKEEPPVSSPSPFSPPPSPVSSPVPSVDFEMEDSYLAENEENDRKRKRKRKRREVRLPQEPYPIFPSSSEVSSLVDLLKKMREGKGIKGSEDIPTGGILEGLFGYVFMRVTMLIYLFILFICFIYFFFFPGTFSLEDALSSIFDDEPHYHPEQQQKQNQLQQPQPQQQPSEQHKKALQYMLKGDFRQTIETLCSSSSSPFSSPSSSSSSSSSSPSSSLSSSELTYWVGLSPSFGYEVWESLTKLLARKLLEEGKRRWEGGGVGLDSLNFLIFFFFFF